MDERPFRGPPEDHRDAIARALIGRTLRPDEHEAIVAAGMDAGAGVLHLRAFLEQTHQMHMERHRFRFVPDGSARLVILGEHALGIARALATRCELPVLARLFPPHIPSWWDELAEEAGPSAEYLILSGRAADSATMEAARQRGLRTIAMQAVSFAGLHPDAIHLPRPPLSPPGLGGWHSRLVIRSFLQGESAAACRARFTNASYELFCYHDRFEQELARIREDDAGCDAAIASMFAVRIRQMPLLRTPLDGSPLLYDLYAEILAPLLGVDLADRHALGGESGLSPVWPIMPEIAHQQRLAYATPLLFGRETETYDIDEFIRRSYDSYRRWAQAPLAALFADAGLSL